MNNVWAKIWLEMLDDPKIATMKDRLWRRWVEVILLAKRVDKGGLIGTTEQIAWALRLDELEAESDLAQLAGIGLVQKQEAGWFIPNFEKRQRALTPAERKAQQRDREKRSAYYEDVTPLSRKVTQNRGRGRTEEEQNRTDAATGKVFAAYEDHIGTLTPMVSESIGDAIDTYTAAWVIEGIKESARNNKRSWSYVDAILRRWERDGFKVDSRGSNNGATTEEKVRRALEKGIKK